MAETCFELEEKVKKGTSEEVFQKKVTCLNRFLGICKHCSEDYGPDHHPNNLDCPDYEEVVMRKVYVHPCKPFNNVHELN